MSHPMPADDPATVVHRPTVCRPTQHNTASNHAVVYAAQGSQTIYNALPAQQPDRRVRGDTWMLLGMLVFDVAFFFYGSTAYTGGDDAGDQWRAVIFFVAVGVTIRALRRWWRRRF